MSARRRGVLLLLLVAAIAAPVIAVVILRHEPAPLPPRPVAQRPTLLLLTSLPLIFNESFSLQGGGSAALERLQSRYHVVPISVTSPGELAKGKLLLMAQPLAQTAENLVAFDDWVRRGGRVMLLADPMLEWPSERPLGDPLRPPPMFADTGLLGHWGLRLDAPDPLGRERRKLAGFDILTVSPGRLSGGCRIGADRLVGNCRIGKGEAIVVADADFIDNQELGRGAAHNLDGLVAELAKLEAK